jgi:hypothetical protein
MLATPMTTTPTRRSWRPSPTRSTLTTATPAPLARAATRAHAPPTCRLGLRAPAPSAACRARLAAGPAGRRGHPARCPATRPPPAVVHGSAPRTPRPVLPARVPRLEPGRARQARALGRRARRGCTPETPPPARTTPPAPPGHPRQARIPPGPIRRTTARAAREAREAQEDRDGQARAGRANGRPTDASKGRSSRTLRAAIRTGRHCRTGIPRLVPDSIRRSSRHLDSSGRQRSPRARPTLVRSIPDRTRKRRGRPGSTRTGSSSRAVKRSPAHRTMAPDSSRRGSTRKRRGRPGNTRRGRTEPDSTRRGLTRLARSLLARLRQARGA